MTTKTYREPQSIAELIKAEQTPLHPRWFIAKYNSLYFKAVKEMDQQRRSFIQARMHWLQNEYHKLTGRMIL